MKFEIKVRALSAALVLGFAVAAQAQNLVTDGGFETAASLLPSGTTYFNSGSSIDGGSWWVTQGQVGVDVTNQYVYDGSGSLFLTSGVGIDAISQFLNTQVGKTYTVSFWANADTNNSFSALFGGIPLSTGPTTINQGAAGGWPGTWTFYSGTVTAFSSVSTLTFLGETQFPGQNPPNVTLEVDDVSVTPAVPEPATLLAFGGGLATLIKRRRSRA